MTVTYEGATEQVRQVIHHHAVLRRGKGRDAVRRAGGQGNDLLAALTEAGADLAALLADMHEPPADAHA